MTGANFLLETNTGKKILIDCGMVQGEQFAEEINGQPFPYDPATIDCLIVTHAHLDHVGRIPKLVKDGFKGKIYSTLQTKELAELVLDDAAGILAEEARRSNTKPIYDRNDIAQVFPLWQMIPYHQKCDIAEGTSFILKDAGHILGSAMIEINVIPAKASPERTFRPASPTSGMRFGSREETFATGETFAELKILFTGDLGNSPAPLLRDTEEIGDVDYLVMESTYGNKNHEPKEQRTAQFEQIIKDAINRGGTLVIPAFSIDRTQVLLYELNNMVEQNRIPKVPVFVDSPMAIKATEIYRDSSELFNDNVRTQIARGDDIFAFPHLEYTISQNESASIEHLKGAKIILAGSGMSVGGRVIGHEEHLLPDPKNTLLLVGYQTAGSLGRRLADGEKKVSIHGNKVLVKAKIETLYGYSAHKDSDHLLGFVATATDRLKKVFVVMGEPAASMYLAQKINNELSVKALLPEKDLEYKLQ